MDNYQKAYWKRQQAFGKKKVTIVISQEAQTALAQKKTITGLSYSAIIEQALLSSGADNSKASADVERFLALEDQLKIISANKSEYQKKLEELEATGINTLSKVTGYEKKLGELEKELKRLKPKRKKRTVK